MTNNISNGESAGVLAPAPVLFVIASGVGAVTEWLRPSALLAQTYSVAVGTALILVSIALVVSVLVQMSRAGTSFDARKATSALILHQGFLASLATLPTCLLRSCKQG